MFVKSINKNVVFFLTVLIANFLGSLVQAETTVSVEVLGYDLTTTDCVASITVKFEQPSEVAIITENGTFDGNYSAKDKEIVDELAPNATPENQQRINRIITYNKERNFEQDQGDITVKFRYSFPVDTSIGINETLNIKGEGKGDFGTIFPFDVTKEITLCKEMADAYAILVQGRISNNEGLEAYNKTLNRVYKTLKERGFIKENIRYFNYNPQQDLDGNGEDDDIFDVPTKEGIQESIDTWLADKIASKPAPAYIIMVDHGKRGVFYLVNDDDNDDNDKITPSDLNGWLDTLESKLENSDNKTAIEKPRFIILGMCYSGSFIPALSKLDKTERIIITSAAENELSYKGSIEPDDGIRAGEFFIEAFFHELGNGNSFKDAFEQASKHTKWFVPKTNCPTTKYVGDDEGRYPMQHPLINANGDDKSETAFIGNDSGDSKWIEKWGTLGVGKKVNDGEYEVTPKKDLNNAEEVEDLYIKPPIEVIKKIDQFEAVIEIRKPSLFQVCEEVSDQNRTGQVEMDLERKDLEYNHEQERFEIHYDGFQEVGIYHIFYIVQNKDGSTPIVKRSQIRKTSNERTILPIELFKPKSGGIQQNTTILFYWQKIENLDGNPITYTLAISNDNFETVHHIQENLSQSFTPVDDSANLKDAIDYYWKVTAIDKFGVKAESEVRVFKTKFDTSPPMSPVSLSLYNEQDSSFVVDASILTDTVPEPLFEDTGHYLFTLEADKEIVLLNISAPGYRPEIVSINAVSGQTSEINVVLTPDEKHPALFSYKTKILLIPALDINSDIFSAQLRLVDEKSDPWKFTLIHAKPLPDIVTNENMAKLDLQVLPMLQIFMPTVVIVDGASGESEHQVKMTFTNPELLEFEWTNVEPTRP